MTSLAAFPQIHQTTNDHLSTFVLQRSIRFIGGH